MKKMYQDPYDKKITNEGKRMEKTKPGHDWEGITRSKWWPLGIALFLFIFTALLALAMYLNSAGPK